MPDPRRYVRNISKSGLSIYDTVEIGDPDLWIPSPDLEAILDRGLRGESLAGLPPRTRSKVVKEKVCRLLGYPVPPSFKKTQPRFVGQQFDTYTQKSNNLQVWNEDLSPTRRYVIIRPSADAVVTCVKVVTGDSLARLDTTGRLTQKYQARCTPGTRRTELISQEDTAVLKPLVNARATVSTDASPTNHPAPNRLLAIGTIFQRFIPLVGTTFVDTGYDQDRNRGAQLHRLICQALGYSDYRDDGRFPDVRHQLLEVKLQTSPTIDLGLVRPDSWTSLGSRVGSRDTAMSATQSFTRGPMGHV